MLGSGPLPSGVSPPSIASLPSAACSVPRYSVSGDRSCRRDTAPAPAAAATATATANDCARRRGEAAAAYDFHVEDGPRLLVHPDLLPTAAPRPGDAFAPDAESRQLVAVGDRTRTPISACAVRTTYFVCVCANAGIYIL